MRSVRVEMAAALLALASGLLSGGAARAETVVVELFTSQGCSACPPADALLAELSEEEDVIALAFHVDYWDAFGWVDPFASPEFSRRQEEYGRRFAVRRYTPQMVVNGGAEMIGHDRRLVGKALRAARHEARPAVRASLALAPGAQKGRLEIVDLSDRETAAAIQEGEGPAFAEAAIWLAGFDSENESVIAGGQNADRRLTYCNVVREWRRIGTWLGEGPLSVEFDRPQGDGGLAVIVQEGGAGRILGAAQLRYGR